MNISDVLKQMRENHRQEYIPAVREEISQEIKIVEQMVEENKLLKNALEDLLKASILDTKQAHANYGDSFWPTDAEEEAVRVLEALKGKTENITRVDVRDIALGMIGQKPKKG